MKREPNPYSKNPRLTVTSIMSISVPSMVAEDVLDGDADKITGVDPAVLDEIKDVSVVAALAYSEVVALQDTVDTIKSDMDNTSRLAYGIQAGYTGHPSNAKLTVDTADGTGLAYFRLTGNSHDVSVSVHDLQNLVNGNIGGGSTGSSGSSSSSYVTYENLAQAQIRFDSNYDTVSIQAADKVVDTDLAYYKLAARGFVSSDWPNAQLRLYGNAGSNIVQLELSSDYGKTWHPITSGDSGSSSDSSSDSTSTLSGFAGVYKDYDSTCLDYKLGLDFDPDTKQAYLIVKNGNAENWQPLVLETSSSSGSSAVSSLSVTTNSDKLYRAQFSYEESCMYVLTQDTASSGLEYCQNIACNCFRDPSGGEWIHHAEMRFTKSTSTDDVEIQLRRDNAHDWITVASTAGAASSASGGDISFSTRGGTDYSLGFEVDKNADDHSVIVSLTSTGSNEFSGITALSTWLCSPSYTAGNENVFMSVSGMGTLIFKSSGSTVEYDLNNLGGDSGSSAPAVAVEDSDAVQAKRLVLSRLSDSRETAGYGWGLRNYRLTAPGTQPSDATAVVYALQTFLAATGMHETVGKLANEAVRTRMALVEGVSQSSTPQFMWWDSDAYKYKKWEPWKEAGSSSSGSTSGSAAGVYELGLLDNGNESASRMLPLVKEQTISDGTSLDILNWAIGWATSNAQETSGMYTLVGNPIALYDSAYRNPNDSRIKGAVRVVDMHGTICWQRYSYTKKQWMIESGDGSSSSGSTSGSAAGVYELGLLDSGSDSGSHMVPLIEETSRALGGDVRSLAAVRWSIGASTTESNDLSGVYTLMANPLALFGHYHDSIDDMHITGAIRPMWTSAGNLAWQKLDYSTKQWKPISTDVKIEITEAYEGIFNVKAEKYDQYQGKNVLVNVPALTSGLGAVFNNTSIVACLKANTATNLRTSGIGIQKTGWDEQYTSFWGGEYDITELVVRAPQICEIASHLSQIRWLCENTASISALINK